MSNTNARTLIDQAVRTLLPYVEDAFFIIDAQGNIQFLNRKAEQITGISRKDYLGKPFEDIIHEKIAYSPTGTGLYSLTMKTPERDIPVEAHISPLHTSGILCMIRAVQKGSDLDLAEVAKSLQNLLTTQHIYKALGTLLASHGFTLLVFPFQSDHFSIGYHTVDPDTIRTAESAAGAPLATITFALQSLYLKKIKEEKFLFFSDIASLLEDASAPFQVFFSQMGLSNGVVVSVIVDNKLTGLVGFFSKMANPDDPVLPLLCVQVSAALERAAHFEHMSVDLHALQNQIDSRTHELKKVKSQMESIIQSSVDAIIATDLEGYVTFVNKGVEAMFGYKKEDILEKSLTRYYAGGKKQGRKHRDTILKKGQLESVEMDFLAKDGRTVRTLASLSLLREKGEVTGIMGVFKDVSKQKRLQKTLESLNKAAVSIQKSRTMEEIFAVTGEELKQFDFHVTFILFNLDRTAGKIVYSTVEVDKSLKNEFLSGYELSLDNSLFRTLLKNQEATYIDDIRSSVQEVLPPALSTVYDTETEYSDINKKAIMAPLIIHGEVTGLLVVLSDVITQEDIPSIRAFANQVSTALENARLLQESQGRADKIAANLEEQHLLRELNTSLFVARSLDEVLDAAIQGIHNLGKSFSNIKLLNKERTNAHIVRFEMEPGVLKTLRKIGEIGRIGYYQVFIGDEDSIYHQFFNNQIPLVTPNISVGSRPVITADLSELYRDIVPKGSGFHRFIASLNQLLSYKSVMMFPLIIDGTTGGSLTVTSKDIFTGEDFELMGTIAEMVSSAVQRVRHGERLTETLNELRAVQRINTLLNMGASINSVLDQICLNIMEVYHYEFAIPLLLDPSRRYLMFNHMVLPSRLAKKMASILGVNPVDFTYPIAEDVSLFKTVIVEKKCLIRKGLKEMADRIPFARFSSVLRRAIPYLSRGLHMDIDNLYFMLAPLPSGEEVMGVLFLGHKNPLTESDFQLLKHFLDQVGVAIAKSEIENRLRQSFKELQELDRMKSEFIDIASHELRTPLTILQLYLEMIAMEHYGELPEKLRERVSIMQGSVNRLEEIIDQTLVASRLIKNKLELEGEQISLVEIATDVVRQLQPLWNAKNQQIFVEDVDLSPVEGDRKALSTVMSNVVDNAIRYSPKDTDILIGFEEHAYEVECTIQDQGYGIPPEYKEKVFDEFYIVPSETEYARMDGRTGLGLFIAKGIVERHNGRIWVESTPSRGSVFHFTVPKKR